MTLTELLAGYRPGDAGEERDLARVREIEADPWRRETALHATVSALVVHPPTRRVLLRWHGRQRAWLQVGGHADPGETDPLAIALREGREETGLTDLVPWPAPRLIHVAVVPVPAGKGEPAHEHADLRIVLATAEPEGARPERPDAPLRWLTVAGAKELTTEPNLRETIDRVDCLLG